MYYYYFYIPLTEKYFRLLKVEKTKKNYFDKVQGFMSLKRKRITPWKFQSFFIYVRGVQLFKDLTWNDPYSKTLELLSTGHWVDTNSKTMQQSLWFRQTISIGDLVPWKVYDNTSHSCVISEWPWLNNCPSPHHTWTVKLLSLSRQLRLHFHQLRLWLAVQLVNCYLWHVNTSAVKKKQTAQLCFAAQILVCDHNHYNNKNQTANLNAYLWLRPFAPTGRQSNIQIFFCAHRAIYLCVCSATHKYIHMYIFVCMRWQ